MKSYITENKLFYQSFENYRNRNFKAIILASFLLSSLLLFIVLILAFGLHIEVELGDFRYFLSILIANTIILFLIYLNLRRFQKPNGLFITLYFFISNFFALYITWINFLNNSFSFAWMLGMLFLAYGYPLPWYKTLIWASFSYAAFQTLVVLAFFGKPEHIFNFASYTVASELFFVLTVYLSHQFHRNLFSYVKELETNKQNSHFKSQVLAILGHDLRNSMGSSYQLASFLLNHWKSLSDEQKHSDLETLYLSLEKDYKLLESLVFWAKSRMGRMSVEISDFLPLEILNKIKTHWNDLLLQKAISLEIHDKANKLKWDPMLFEIVMRNLIHNAIKNSPPKSTIYVDVERYNGSWVALVDDQGPGFEGPPIQDGEIANPETFSKSGLGIKLMAELLEPSGAHLEFENKPERGARVKLVFEAPHSQAS